jgi:hypothetical protein
MECAKVVQILHGSLNYLALEHSLPVQLASESNPASSSELGTGTKHISHNTRARLVLRLVTLSS